MMAAFIIYSAPMTIHFSVLFPILNKKTPRYVVWAEWGLGLKQKAASDQAKIARSVYGGSGLRLEVVSQPRITPEGKVQADSKAQQTR
jgi:hypothetical protein